MMNRQRIRREDVERVFSRRGQRWSRWYVALKPEGNTDSQSFEEREKGDSGVIYSKIRDKFPKDKYDEGIYELMVSREGDKFVVYVGSACRDDPRSIHERVMEYYRGGSHLDKQINRAMENGYTLSVRAKNVTGDRDCVLKCEREFLEKYDYAWNSKNNGRVRNNIPPSVR